MQLTRSAALAAVLATAVASAAPAQTVDTVVATVNGTEITLGHMAAFYDRLPPRFRELPPEAIYTGILEQLIQQSAVAEMRDELSQLGELTLANEARALRAAEVIAGVSRDAVSDEAVQAAYDALFADLGSGIEYNANHILVETQEQAADLKVQIDAGADFEEVARQNSTDTAGPNGGALGWFGPGMMVRPFEVAVMQLEPGEVSEPVQTQFGWHLVKLNETRQQQAPQLEEVRSQIEDQVRQEAVNALIESAMAQAEVTRSDEAIDPTVVTNQSLFSE